MTSVWLKDALAADGGAPAETLEIFAFLQAMKESRAQNGAVVTLKKL